MIEIDFEGGRGAFRLQVCFTAPADGVTAVFGASGSGKSTLLDMIAGHLSPDRGRLVIAGRVLLDTVNGIDLPAAHRRIGWVPQDGLLFLISTSPPICASAQSAGGRRHDCRKIG